MPVRLVSVRNTRVVRRAAAERRSAALAGRDKITRKKKTACAYIPLIRL